MRSALALISLCRQNKDNCFGYNELQRNTMLNMRSGRNVCKSDEMISGLRPQPRCPPKPNYYFWPVYNVPWNLYANLFGGICIKPTN